MRVGQSKIVADQLTAQKKKKKLLKMHQITPCSQGYPINLLNNAVEVHNRVQNRVIGWNSSFDVENGRVSKRYSLYNTFTVVMPHTVVMVTLLRRCDLLHTATMLMYGYESSTNCAQDSITISEYNSSEITSQIWWV